MIKKELGFILILVVLMGFVSAGFFSDFFKGFNGKVILDNEGWTPWLDRDNPSGNGDYETLVDFVNSDQVCENPSKIEYRAISGVAGIDYSQKIHSSITVGFYCLNSENPEGCLNYEVRFYCGEEEKPFCGNSVKENDEQCDRNDFGNATCASVLGPEYEGALMCDSLCKIDTSLCEKKENQTCTDSDGGLNYYIASTAVVYQNGIQIDGRPDYCFPDSGSLKGYVNEVYCEGNAIKSTSYKCPNGCENGACVNESSEGWTQWLNRDTPGGNGDYETLVDFVNSDQVCENPSKIEYRAISGVAGIDYSQKIHSSITVGFYCLNSENPEGCLNYEVRFYCGNVNETLINISISVATLKDNYSVGEKIELTDPPEVFSEDFSEIQNKDDSYEGYIVEFKDGPIIVEKERLSNIAEKNEKYVQEKEFYNPVRIYKQIFSIMPEDVGGKVKDYSLSLDKTHNLIKNRIDSLEKIEIEKEFTKTFNGIVLNISEEEAKQIENIRGVKSVYPNYKVYADLMDSVLLINADDVWQLDEDGNDCSVSGKECLTGKGITIAIIDTGVDYTHGDLGGCFGEGCKVVGGYDFVYNDNNPMDDNGHGTHCAATAAGKGMLKGVAPDAELYAFKVLNGLGNGLSSDIIAAIEMAIDLDNDGNIMEDENDFVDIISMSLGGEGNPDDPSSKAIDNVVNAGVVAVIAAGNSGPYKQTIGSPGTAREAITVAASDKQNIIAGFSSRGPVVWKDLFGDEKIIIKPDITAPGVDICAAQWDNAFNDDDCFGDGEHVAISGTSMATPHIAGVVALLKQKNPGWTPQEIKNSLKGTAVDIGENVLTQGSGRVDVLEVIKLENPLEGTWDFFVYSDNSLNNFYDEIVIKGVFPEDYFSLILEYSFNGINWESNGINIVGEGNVVAEFNPQGNILETGNYEFRARIVKDGSEKISVVEIYFDERLKEGWMKELNIEGYNSVLTKPIVSDLDGDGNKEIIITLETDLRYSRKSKIYIFNSEGEFFNNNWPKEVDSHAVFIAIADLDNDSKKEIVGSGYDSFDLHVWDLNGNSFQGNWPIHFDGQLTIPTIINNKGSYEIVVGIEGEFIPNPRNSKLVRLDSAGNLKGEYGMQSSTYFSGRAAPVAGDIDNDGYLELGIATLNFEEQGGGSIYFWNLDGSAVNGWPKQVGNSYASPLLGDMDGDNNLEIILPPNLFYSDGSVYSGNWPLSYPIYAGGPNSLYDIDGEEGLEVAVYSDGYSNIVFNKDGQIVKRFSGEGRTYGYGPVIADVDGDGNVEILNTFTNGLIDVRNLEDVPLENFPINLGEQNFEVQLSLGDIDNNGKKDLIFVTPNNLYVLEFPYFSESSEFDWLNLYYDERNTGCYNCEESFIPPEPPIERPQSKIVNNENVDINGILTMKLQKKNVQGKFVDEKIVVNQSVWISANSLIKLDIGGNYGWNNQNIYVNSSGEYQIYIIFDMGGQKEYGFWEFNVK